jgi:peptidoglycan hydrolase-like protein with peptidoglycan-binding domain
MTTLPRRRTLFAGAALALTATGLAVPANAYSGTPDADWGTIRRTSQKNFILAGQHLLNGHGFSNTASGTWSSSTTNAIARASAAFGFKAWDSFGYALLHRMAMDRREGHTGHVVRAAQVLLNQRSNAGLLVDGYFGPVMKQAVRTYQSRQGLVVDGWIGKITWGRFMPDRDTSGGGGGGGSLVVVNQMFTGYFSSQNCGPSANVVALVGVGRTPSGYSSNMNGNRAVVEAMRVSCGLSPAGRPTVASRSYWGADLHNDLERGLKAHGAGVQRATHVGGIDAARSGRTVILNVHHANLVAGSSVGGHYVVARGTDSSGRIRVSDPGRAESIGIRGYSRTQLIRAEHLRFDRSLIIS